MMSKWLVFLSLVWVFLVSPVWATDTGSVNVTAVEMSNDGFVNVTTSVAFLPAGCYGKLTFTYSENTLSDVYYTMLMTAKSVGLEVDLSYTELPTQGYCELRRVEIIRRD